MMGEMPAAITLAATHATSAIIDGVADSRGQDLVNYISSGWVTGLKPETIRPISLNGLEAATAKAAADRWEFDVTVVRIDKQIYRFLTAVPAGSKALEPTAAILKSSFRKLTPAEVAALPKKEKP